MVTVVGQCKVPGTLIYIMPVIVVVFRTKFKSQGFLGFKEISGPWGLDLSRHVTNATQGGSNVGKTIGIFFTNYEKPW